MWVGILTISLDVIYNQIFVLPAPYNVVRIYLFLPFVAGNNPQRSRHSYIHRGTMELFFVLAFVLTSLLQHMFYG